MAAISLDSEGEVVNFIRNDKCAAGTGRFLEMMCRKLEVEIGALDEVAGRAKNPTAVSNQCVVYAESEAISHLNSGATTEDVIAGICGSVGRMALSLARRFSGLDRYVLTGGVAPAVP